MVEIAARHEGDIGRGRIRQTYGNGIAPLYRGNHNRAAIKTIDHRGNEVMRVLFLD